MSKKKMTIVLANALSAMMLFSGCSIFEQVDTSRDETKSQLQISVRDSGFGTNWFSALARGFEEKYAGVSFEEDKMGVQVTDVPKRDNAGASLLGTIKNASDAVLGIENLHYVDYATTNTGIKSTYRKRTVWGIGTRTTTQISRAFYLSRI